MCDDANSYDDPQRARAYSRLSFGGTYFLAYRDLPAIIRRHTRGSRAIDFGCGSGRSTRFLRGLGFETIGVDISPAMLNLARSNDPAGTYILAKKGDVHRLDCGPADLVLCAFPFDNIRTLEEKAATLRMLGALLNPAGRLVNIVSSPDLYLHEWASFSTRAFPENRDASSGGIVRISITDMDDERPVEDVVCSDSDYRRAFSAAGLQLVETHRPLGRPEDPYEWISESVVPPWTVYVLSSGLSAAVDPRRQR